VCEFGFVSVWERGGEIPLRDPIASQCKKKHTPMTLKQEERIRNKIVRIRKELAQDKKRWGGFYDDSRGLKYLPSELFIKHKDYNGGLRYLRWFDRTFSDDSGFPIFLFEWTLILFQTGNIKETLLDF
jgi:hypothetical protein